MVGKQLFKRLNDSTLFAIFRTLPWARRVMGSFAAISVVDTLVGQLLTKAISEQVPNVADLLTKLSIWVWLYVLLLILLIASIQYFGREIRALSETAREIKNDPSVGRLQNSYSALVSRIDTMDQTLQSNTATDKKERGKMEKRLDRIHEALTARERISKIQAALNS